MISGKLTWATDRDVHIEMEWDKIAVDATANLMFLSAVGYAQMAKALRAGLASNLKDPMKLLGAGGSQATLFANGRSRGVHGATCYAGGYHAANYRLNRDQVHITFVAKSRGLLMNDSDEALWQELKHERFETPLLRSWVPYIKQQLLAIESLHPCWCYDCELWELSTNTKTLDDIVVAGVTAGELKIAKDAA